MNSSTPKRPQSMASAIYERILSDIINIYQVHEKLPTEVQLSEQYGASRTVIREALTQLKEDGLVSSKRGSGNFVVKKPASTVLQFATVSSISDIQRCFEFRTEIESGAAGLAASRRTDKQMQSIIDASNAITDAIAKNNLATEHDYNFHFAVAEATNNSYFIVVLQSLQESIKQGMNLTRTLSLQSSSKRSDIVQNEHEAIVDAIKNQDSTAAEKAMRTHLTNARIRMFEGDS